MVSTLHLICLAFAFVLFVLAGLNIAEPRYKIGYFGLAFLVLALWLH